jgi:hypothetical protein
MICILYVYIAQIRLYLYICIYTYNHLKNKYCKEVSFYSFKMQSTLHQFNRKRYSLRMLVKP